MPGDELRRRLDQAMHRAESALDLWMLEVTTYRGWDEMFFPDSLETTTAALFDRVPAACLVAILEGREVRT